MFSFLRSKRPFKLTKGGWIFILYTIGVGAGAINTGNNLLYLVFGLFLGLILASGVLSDLMLWGLEITPIFPERGRVGEPLFFPVEIRNRKPWFPSMGLRVQLKGRLGGEPFVSEGFCPAVPAAGTADCVVVTHPKRRGALVLTDVSFSTRFPFGLLTKFWNTPFVSGEMTLILPRRVSVETSPIFLAAQNQLADRNSPQRGHGASLFGIRDFQPTDNPRRIHWKASAKRSEGWLVREMENEETDSIRLRWPDTLPPAPEMERFLSYVSSVVDVFLSRRYAVSLAGFDGRAWILSGDEIERFLCVVGTPDEKIVERPAAISVGDGIDLTAAFQDALPEREPVS